MRRYLINKDYACRWTNWQDVWAVYTWHPDSGNCPDSWGQMMDFSTWEEARDFVSDRIKADEAAGSVT